MAHLNRPSPHAPLTTHEGAPARHITVFQQLRRSVNSCLLWEKQFYEDGEEISKRIAGLVALSNPRDVAELAINAREKMHLRHVPLLLLRELARHPGLPDKLLSTTMGRVIQRADELTEFMAIYWRDGKTPVSKQVKRGLAWAFRKFDEYQLAKYDRENAIRLRDVLFLTHAVPKDHAQAALWKKLASNELAVPDTWEVQLSGGADKKATFERLIREGKLGYLALLRNLRNMTEAKVDPALVAEAIIARKGGAERVLPFRYLAAAKHAPMFEPVLDASLQMALGGENRLSGKTVVLVDNSGSMYAPLSMKSDLYRSDAAAGVAIVARGLCLDARVFVFSNNMVEVPPRNGMALRDVITNATEHGGTNLGAAIQHLFENVKMSRLIVITDEQSHDQVMQPPPGILAYMINVASYQNGVGYGRWTHIDGFSEAVIRFIIESEQSE